MSRLKNASFVDPAFKIRQKDPPVSLTATIRAAHSGDDVTIYDSSNWAGAVDLDSSGDFNYIDADWTVPDPNPGKDKVNYWCSDAWVGLDGWNSSDVLQGGTTQDVWYGSDGSLVKDIYAWYEWYPAYAIEITNLSVSAGDVVMGVVWADNSTTGNFYIYNYTTNQWTSINFSAPNGTSLKGDSAEWIVEDRIGNSLADFGQVVFTYCSARNGSAWEDLADADLIYMEESRGEEATAQIKNDTTLVVTYN